MILLSVNALTPLIRVHESICTFSWKTLVNLHPQTDKAPCVPSYRIEADVTSKYSVRKAPLYHSVVVKVALENLMKGEIKAWQTYLFLKTNKVELLFRIPREKQIL